MFIETNDRTINLKNVSNINIIRNRRRIVFNMNYSIKIRIGDERFKVISDYVYWDAETDTQFAENRKLLVETNHISANFITGSDDNCWINVGAISSIKLVDQSLKAIINLSNPVSYTDGSGNDKITSEFIYVKFKNEDLYFAYKDYINDMLNTRGK